MPRISSYRQKEISANNRPYFKKYSSLPCGIQYCRRNEEKVAFVTEEN
jgi:hypothetical protein